MQGLDSLIQVFCNRYEQSYDKFIILRKHARKKLTLKRINVRGLNLPPSDKESSL